MFLKLYHAALAFRRSADEACSPEVRADFIERARECFARAAKHAPNRLIALKMVYLKLECM